MRRRLLAIVVSLAMCLSLVPAMAFAAEEIKIVEVTIAPPKVGEGPQKVSFQIPEGSNYEVTASSDAWIDSDGTNVATSIIGGNDYKVYFTVTAIGGYSLSDSAVVMVNGSNEGVNTTNGASTFEYTYKHNSWQLIESIELTDVPEAAINGTAGGYSSEGTNYEASGFWQIWDYASSDWASTAFTGTFQNGNIYRFNLNIETDPGYCLSEDCGLTVNDDQDALDGDWYYNNRSDGRFWKFVSYATEINEVDIDGSTLPKAKLGEAFSSDNPIALDTPANANYSLSGHWICRDNEGNETLSGTFENGKVYYFVIDIMPKQGYSLLDDLSVTVDGEWMNLYQEGASKATVEVRTSFARVIDEVELLDLPTATIGAKLKEGNFSVGVPSGAGYSATARWYVSGADGSESVDADDGTNVVKNGKSYYLEVDIRPNDGYEFASSVALKAYGVSQKLYPNSDFAYFERTFSFRTAIDEAQVTGVTRPVAGAVPTVDGLKVPAGANYRIDIDDTQWYDADSHEPVTQFEQGRDYYLDVVLVAADGYEFSRNVLVSVDGQSLSWSYRQAVTEFYAQATYSLKETVPEVRINDVPSMKVGEVAQASPTVPADANYHISEAFWLVWDDETKQYERFSGTFESGKVYELYVSIVPAKGYRFTDGETAYYVNGRKSGDVAASGSWANYCKEYAEGLAAIDRIELKVNEPVAGEHSSISPVVSIVGGSGFAVDGEGVLEWLVGDLDRSVGFYDDYFAADGSYGVRFALLADKGYVFSEDVVVVVNGATLPASALNGGMKTLTCDHFFSMDKDGAASGGLANTGDDARAVVWAGLALAGLAVCVASFGSGVRARRSVQRR